MSEPLRHGRSGASRRSPHWFWWAAAAACGGYALLTAGMLAADAAYLASSNGPGILGSMHEALSDAHVRRSLHLTLVTCSISAVLSVLVATPVAYLLSRTQFTGKRLVEAAVDVPIALPPLAVGLSLLILLQWLPSTLRDGIVYQVPAIVVAQFVVASALAIRVLRAAFEQSGKREEAIARTLGASPAQAFGWIALLKNRGALLSAGLLSWARSMGEFGPVLILAGATRGKTEVLATTVFLELSVGNLRGAVAIALLMIAASAAALTVARLIVRN